MERRTPAIDAKMKDRFNALWTKYFNDAELPITFYYTSEEGHADLAEPDSLPRCVVGALAAVREGSSLCFDVNSIGCPGGRRYLGFAEGITPDFEYFLSYGMPSRVRGERYIKSPELVREIMAHWPTFKAPSCYIVFKRWDRLDTSDDPQVVIFFAQPDVLSGLFTLARFDEEEPNAVFTPFGSGCSTIVQYPFLERDSKRPRGVIGMFDPSARPHVSSNALTFAVPMSKFVRMIDNMQDSFLITDTWKRIQERIGSIEGETER